MPCWWACVGECGLVWARVGECGRGWASVGECGRVWVSVGECGRVWSSVGLPTHPPPPPPTHAPTCPWPSSPPSHARSSRCCLALVRCSCSCPLVWPPLENVIASRHHITSHGGAGRARAGQGRARTGGGRKGKEGVRDEDREGAAATAVVVVVVVVVAVAVVVVGGVWWRRQWVASVVGVRCHSVQGSERMGGDTLHMSHIARALAAATSLHPCQLLPHAPPVPHAPHRTVPVPPPQRHRSRPGRCRGVRPPPALLPLPPGARPDEPRAPFHGILAGRTVPASGRRRPWRRRFLAMCSVAERPVPAIGAAVPLLPPGQAPWAVTSAHKPAPTRRAFCYHALPRSGGPRRRAARGGAAMVGASVCPLNSPIRAVTSSSRSAHHRMAPAIRSSDVRCRATHRRLLLHKRKRERAWQGKGQGRVGQAQERGSTAAAGAAVLRARDRSRDNEVWRRDATDRMALRICGTCKVWPYQLHPSIFNYPNLAFSASRHFMP